MLLGVLSRELRGGPPVPAQVRRSGERLDPSTGLWEARRGVCQEFPVPGDADDIMTIAY